MIDDGELLRQYLEDRSEAAFTELVRRHLNVVYFAALRRVGGDRHLANDVAQGVFADLAKKAAALKERPILVGWLYTSTRFAAAQAVRTEQRRRTHEQEAQTMQELHPAPEANWEQLRPVIDDAMDELNEQEREVVLLRFFERLPLAEVGARFAISTDAARMRVDRALDKLRGLLARRGIASTSTALGAVVATQSALAAPAGMVARIAGAVLHRSGAAAAATFGLGKIVGGLVLGGCAVGLVVYETSRLHPAPAGSSPEAVAQSVRTAPDRASGGPSAAEVPAGAAPAALPPAAAVPPTAPAASGFSQLSVPAQDLLKALWTLQEASGRNAGIIVAEWGQNFSVYSAGRQALLAAGLGEIGPGGGIRLTAKGQALCSRSQGEIDAFPAFFPAPANR